MKFTLRDVADPMTILDVGTKDNEIDGPDSCAAALKALEIAGLLLVRVDDPKYTTVNVEMLPDGRMTEENAAKYLGYSVVQLRSFRRRSKYDNDNDTKRCPKFYKKMGKIFYRKEDLDRWISSGDITTKALKKQPSGWNRWHKKKEEEKVPDLDNI